MEDDGLAEVQAALAKLAASKQASAKRKQQAVLRVKALNPTTLNYGESILQPQTLALCSKGVILPTIPYAY